MLPGNVFGVDTGLDKVFEAVGRYKNGKIGLEELTEYECNACPGAGSCSGMFTANTMSNLSEALGIGLPFKRFDPCSVFRQVILAKQTGLKAVETGQKDRSNPEIL